MEWLWIVVNSCCESSHHSLREAAVSHGYTTFTEKGICSSYLSPGFDPGKCYNVLDPVTKLKYPPGSSTLYSYENLPIYRRFTYKHILKNVISTAIWNYERDLHDIISKYLLNLPIEKCWYVSFLRSTLSAVLAPLKLDELIRCYKII